MGKQTSARTVADCLQMVCQTTEVLSIRTNVTNRKASLTNGDHLAVVPLVRVFSRLIAGCVYWTCRKDFSIVNCAQLNLKHTETENYVNILYNARGKWKT